eukprot:PhF_6_TR922/c0_g1_i1/m.1563
MSKRPPSAVSAPKSAWNKQPPPVPTPTHPTPAPTPTTTSSTTTTRSSAPPSTPAQPPTPYSNNDATFPYKSSFTGTCSDCRKTLQVSKHLLHPTEQYCRLCWSSWWDQCDRNQRVSDTFKEQQALKASRDTLTPVEWNAIPLSTMKGFFVFKHPFKVVSPQEGGNLRPSTTRSIVVQ